MAHSYFQHALLAFSGEISAIRIQGEGRNWLMLGLGMRGMWL